MGNECLQHAIDEGNVTGTERHAQPILDAAGSVREHQDDANSEYTVRVLQCGKCAGCVVLRYDDERIVRRVQNPNVLDSLGAACLR